MNVRCPYCRTSFNLSRDFVVQAVAEAKEKKQKYHGVECIKCRKLIKVSIKEMQRHIPRQTEPESEEAEAN
jgi:DNA-directed RNA polymerase subunit RPC12/RpoP